MKQPRPHSITIFMTEGNPTAIQVRARGTRMVETRRRFPDPAAALAWCRSHRAGFVYTPAAPRTLRNFRPPSGPLKLACKRPSTALFSVKPPRPARFLRNQCQTPPGASGPS